MKNTSEEIILSICIPTYNRREYLERAVNSALAIYRPQIEIIISDNSSTDDTESYCRNLVIEHSQINYYRNSENIGADGNFLQLLKIAKGKYIHILSDDDIVRCDDIDKFLEYLQSNDFSLGSLFNIWHEGESNLSANPNVIYKGKEIYNFIKKHGIDLTFISSLLFSKEAISEIQNPERYKNTYLLQAHIAALTLKGGCAADIFNYYVKATPNASGGYNIYEVFIHNWHSVLFDSMRSAGIPKRVLRQQFSKDLRYSFPYLVKDKAIGINFITKPKWRNFKYSFGYAYGIFVILPVLLMPKFIVRFLYRIYKKIKQKRSTT